MSKQKQVEEAVSTAVNVPGAVAEVDGKRGTFYKLLVETPSPWEQIKMSPHDPMFWLSVNGQWVPRALIEENRNRLVVNADDRKMYLWGTASELDFLHPDCFPSVVTEKGASRELCPRCEGAGAYRKRSRDSGRTYWQSCRCCKETGYIEKSPDLAGSATSSQELASPEPKASSTTSHQSENAESRAAEVKE
jgi:hypothetical protein